MLRESVPQIAPVGPEVLRQLSGLEILRTQIKGDLPAAPIDRYTGIRLIEADDGRVVFSLPARSNLVQEMGTVFPAGQERKRGGGTDHCAAGTDLPPLTSR